MLSSLSNFVKRRRSISFLSVVSSSLLHLNATMSFLIKLCLVASTTRHLVGHFLACHMSHSYLHMLHPTHKAYIKALSLPLTHACNHTCSHTHTYIHTHINLHRHLMNNLSMYELTFGSIFVFSKHMYNK